MKSRYVVVRADSMDDLVDRVNGRMQGGYIPIGGVTVSCSDTYGKIWAQSMLFLEVASEDNSQAA